MKNKIILSIGIGIFIIVLSFVCYILINKYKSVDGFIDLKSVNSVMVVDGGSGDITEISDQNELHELITSLEKIQLKKVSREKSTGWILKLMLKNSKKNLSLLFIDYDICEINGKYYKTKNSDDNFIEFLDKYN